jgi:cytochrome P450
MPDATRLAAPQLVGAAPPPAKPLSFLRQLRAAGGNSYETLPLIVYEEPIHQQKSLFGRMLMVNDPEGVRRVLVDNVANYPKNALENRFFTAMFGEGLLSSEAAKWRTHRKVMAPAFDPRSVTAYAAEMSRTTQEFAGRWDALADDVEVDITEEMKALTLRIICRTMFSSDADELVALAGGALGFTQSALNFSLLDLLPVIGPRRMKAKEEAIHADFSAFDAAIYRMIAEREKDLEDAPKDLLTRLIAAKDPENGAGLDAQEVRDEVITIFMAGHETTAVTMTFVWYLLSQRPAQEATLHAELEAVLAGRAPTAQDLPRLTYTRMVIEEAMRLYPPAPGLSMRQARAADEIGAVKVKAGDQIFISPWILHRHRLLWDDPLEFDPERFSAARGAGRPRFAYMPFGGGPRICIGAGLALTEASLILANLAQRHRPRLVDGQDIKLRSRITLGPRDGMRMTLQRRVPVGAKSEATPGVLEPAQEA